MLSDDAVDSESRHRLTRTAEEDRIIGGLVGCRPSEN
jgi:hypothetical protein